MEKVVIINSGNESIINKYKINTISTLKSLSPLMRIIRGVSLSINSNLISWFSRNDWIDEIDRFQTVILFDCMGMVNIAKLIDSRYTDKRKIIFYWNPIKDDSYKSIPESFEIWTSDHDDSLKYGFKYGGQFVYEKFFANIDKSPSYDVYFVGINKGRFKSLKKIERQLKNKGLVTLFRYVDSVKSFYNKHYSHPIPYETVVKETAKANILMEYNQKGQKGLTLRCVESIILQKKLITNNKEVLNLSLYNPQNIYIINNEIGDGFDAFVNSPFSLYTNETVSLYFFSSWLTRILSNKEINDYHSI